jgi:hypothetical protein
MKSRPELPKKEPKESRKPLSLSVDLSNLKLAPPTTLSFHVHSPFSEENNYIDPIEQPPSLNLNVTNENDVYNKFFNESAYFLIDQYFNQTILNDQTNCQIKSIIVEDFHKIDQNEYLYLKESSSLDKSQNEHIKNEADKSSSTDEHSGFKHIEIDKKNDDEKKVETNNKVAPNLPPKRTNNKYLSCLSNVVEQSNQETHMNFQSDDYIQPSESDFISLDDFKFELFRKSENRLCADCKSTQIEPKWISGLYFVTLCSDCAEVHMQLPHINYKYYLIKINDLFFDFMCAQSKKSVSNLRTFIEIFKQTGNEKMNSLFEYQIDKARCAFESKPISEFIKDKYMFKSFVNSQELDFKVNFVHQLNAKLFKNVCGPCISITIYNIFLGANVNFCVHAKSVLDQALESNQSHQAFYLKLNRGVSYALVDFSLIDYEFQGILKQVNESSRSAEKYQIDLKFQRDKVQMRQVSSSSRTEFDYKSIIKIFAEHERFIHLKWCKKINNSLISTHFECQKGEERNTWMKEFCYKLICSMTSFGINAQVNESIDNLKKLQNIIEMCQVTSIGFLNLLKCTQTESNAQDEQASDLCLLILIESLQSQVEEFFVSDLLLIHHELVFERLDLRKLMNVRKMDYFMQLEMPGRIYRFDANGYMENLDQWVQRLTLSAKLKCESLEDQYLTKDNVPLLIEKCCTFIELNFTFKPCFYVLKCSHSLFDVESKRALTLFDKLLKDNHVLLDSQDSKLNPFLLLNIFKAYFYRYVRMKDLHLLIKEIEKLSDDLCYDQLDLNAFKLKNTIFYNCLKRICVHLNIIAHFKDTNQMDSKYLSDLFASLILHKHKTSFSSSFTCVLKYLIENCSHVFDLKDDYLNLQYDIVEKSFALKHKSDIISMKQLKSSYLTTIYLNRKNSDKSFQISIEDETMCEDVLKMAKNKFDLCDSKYWCLFEVVDREHTLNSTQKSPMLLERLLPINYKLIDGLSNWTTFVLVVKCNYIQIEIEKAFLLQDNFSNSLSFVDDCEMLVLCKNCAYLTRTSGIVSSNQPNGRCDFHRKWKNSAFSVQNAYIRIHKRTKTNKSLFLNELDNSKSKPIYESKIEDCIFYYGLYDSFEVSKKSIMSYSESIDDLTFLTKLLTNVISPSSDPFSASTSSPSNSVNKENCLTFYDLKSNLIFLINLNDKTKALGRYNCLFRVAFYPNKWSLFHSDKLPHSIRNSVQSNN